MVKLEELERLDIRIARILEAKDHPNADKLLILKIDTGDKQKQIIAGIKNFYRKEDLLGKQVVIIDNLEPAMIRGESSQGMLLAAQSAQTISVLIPDKPIKEGSKVK